MNKQCTIYHTLGFSLVEVMIAITLSLTLLVGVVQVMSNNKNGYRIQNNLTDLTENGRNALNILEHALYLADHWGGVSATEMSGTPAVSNDCATGWATTKQGIIGYEGATTSPLIDCISNTYHVVNTDLLGVRYADPDSIVLNGILNNSDNETRLFVRVIPGRRGEIILGNEKDAALTRLPDSPGTVNFRYDPSVYYIRKCSVTTDSCSDQIPTLVKVHHESGTTSAKMTTDPLIEYIEQLQITFGVDADNNGDAEQYFTANNVTNWTRVVSAYVGVIARSSEIDLGFIDTNTYAMPGYTFDPGDKDYLKLYPNSKNYYRKLFLRLIQLRNRVRG